MNPTKAAHGNRVEVDERERKRDATFGHLFYMDGERAHRKALEPVGLGRVLPESI